MILLTGSLRRRILGGGGSHDTAVVVGETIQLGGVGGRDVAAVLGDEQL